MTTQTTFLVPTKPPAVVVSPSASWNFSGLLVHQTSTTCRCGHRFRGVELFEVYAADGKCAGKPTTALRYIPYEKPSFPEDWKILSETRVRGVAVCPECLPKRQKQADFRPLDLSNWRETVRRKAIEAEESRKKKPPTKKSDPTNLTVDDLINLGI